jgi:DNA-binding LacI/PurR family transcriptional regulator
MATLADVAKLAHVSTMTVSRVINHPEKVSPDVRADVAAAIKELNYQVNRAGLALREQKSFQVEFLMLEDVDTTDPYFGKLAFFLADALGAYGYSLILGTDVDNIAKQVDGVIVSGARGSDYEKLAKLDIPVVVYGEIESDKLSSVDVDNAQGVYLAAKHLASSGYSHLVLLDWTIDEPFAQHRRHGFEVFLKERPELTSERIGFTANDDRTVKSRLNTMAFPENTGIIAMTDRLGLGAYQALRAAIPDKIGLIGFDGVFLDQASEQPLTTIQQPLQEIADELIAELAQRLNGKSATAILVPPTILTQGTTKITK